MIATESKELPAISGAKPLLQAKGLQTCVHTNGSRSPYRTGDHSSSPYMQSQYALFFKRLLLTHLEGELGAESDDSAAELVLGVFTEVGLSKVIRHEFRVGRIHIVSRVLQVQVVTDQRLQGVIQEVVGRDAELQPFALCDREALRQGQVVRVVGRPLQVGEDIRARLARRRRREAVRVQVLIIAPAAARVAGQNRLHRSVRRAEYLRWVAQAVERHLGEVIFEGAVRVSFESAVRVDAERLA